MIILPDPQNNKSWFQHNKSDVLGSLWSSFNLNLTDQIGKIKVSPRMIVNEDSLANWGLPYAVKRLSASQGTYILAGGASFKQTGSPGNAIIADPDTNAQTSAYSSDNSDLEVYNGRLYATTGGAGVGIWWNDGAGTWTFINSVLTANQPHKLLKFDKTNRLYIQKGNLTVVSLDTSNSVASSGTNTIALTNPDLIITSLLQTASYIWILTINKNNGNGFVYIWNGVTADTFMTAYPLNSRGAVAGVVKDGTPYIIDTDGKLLYFNGGSFVVAPNGRLPLNQFKYLKNPVAALNTRWIHPNGMTIVDERINILINNENYDTTTSIEESLPSGIWEYVENGSQGFWYHKDSLTQSPNFSGGVIVSTLKDYGQNRISQAGALVNIKSDNSSQGDNIAGTLYAGATYFINASSTKSALYANNSSDMYQKYGYFVTTKIFAQNIQDSWRSLFIRFRRFITSSDKIWVKYRNQDIPPTEVTITWLTTSSFTTISSLSAYAVGDEMEVTQGTGGGFCSHITAIQSVSGGGYMVSVDETYANATGTAKARFQKWTKISSFSNQTENFHQFPPMTIAPWVQLKVCMLFTGNDEVYDLLLDSVPHQ